MPTTSDVSVVVPHMKSRDYFYEEYCLPSIQANNPGEIITLSGNQPVQWKRNRGASNAKGEFLFFCDDDVILPASMFAKMLDAMGDTYDFAYCDYKAVDHPTKGFTRHDAKPFNLTQLQKLNYISTMSMIRASKFPGFDESLERLQDWDLFLTMAERGSMGIYVEHTNFIAFWLDEGITKKGGWEQANQAVRRKHGI